MKLVFRAFKGGSKRFRCVVTDADSTLSVSVVGPYGVLRRTFVTANTVVFLATQRWFVAEGFTARFYAIIAYIKNAIRGVCFGYYIDIRLVGVGFYIKRFKYRSRADLGFSHLVTYKLLESVLLATAKYRALVFGYERERVSRVAHDLRNLSKPDAYKGKGVKFSREKLRLKPGKQRQR